MRVHTTLDAAEGQRHDTPQQAVGGVATAAKSPTVVAFTLTASCSGGVPSVARRSPLAPPLCRCQEGQVLRAFRGLTRDPDFVSPEDGCLPYNKPSFPSPGGHSSSGTASSKSSTGPRKTDGPRQPQQWTVTEHADFLGSTGQGQYSGELCECFGGQ